MVECKLCRLGVLAESLRNDLSIGKVSVWELAQKYDTDEETVKNHIENHYSLQTLSTIRTDTNNFEEWYSRSISLMVGLEEWVSRVIRDMDDMSDYRIRQLTSLTREYRAAMELILKLEQYREETGYADDAKWKTRYEQLIEIIVTDGCDGCKELLLEVLDDE